MYTVQAREVLLSDLKCGSGEDVNLLLERLGEMRRQKMNGTWSFTQLSLEDFQQEQQFLRASLACLMSYLSLSEVSEQSGSSTGSGLAMPTSTTRRLRGCPGSTGKP